MRWGLATLLLLAGPAFAAGLLDRARSPEAARLTDGVRAAEGDPWDSPAALRLPPAGVEWDLGEEQKIGAVVLQADNDDDYVLSGSVDGRRFVELWSSGKAEGAGLRTRRVEGLEGRARWLRLTARGGDGRSSASELQVYSGRLGLWAERLRPFLPADCSWAFGLLAIALLLFAVRRGTPIPWLAAASLCTGGMLAGLFQRSVIDPPGVDPARLDGLRGAVAALAFLAVLREGMLRRRRPAHRGFTLALLCVTAVLGPLCFLNLGRPQFFDAGKGRPTYLHHYDMRTYFPIARFFPEVRFDGVYAVSALAVAEDRGGVDAIGDVGLRDLRTHAWSNVRAVSEHLKQVRARFTDERWRALTADLHYFRSAMGDPAFLGSMNDHGGNATPVWFLAARGLYGRLPASDFALWLGVAVDVLLLALAFVALAWAFGPRTALIAATLFGTIDFYQFGTNWFGAALRHDWLSLWCLGLCALKKERFGLAGGLLAWASLIRAFPALTFFTLAAPPAWDLLGRFTWQRSAREPLAALWMRHRGLLRVALGAAVTGSLLFLASVAVFGFAAWVDWRHKVSLLNAGDYMNTLSLRAVLGPRSTLQPLLAGLGTLGILLAARRAPPAEAAAWGVALLPLWLNPANYYLHSVLLLAVLASEDRAERAIGRPAAWLILCAMCVASAFTSFDRDLPAHFQRDTIVLFAALGALVLASLRVRTLAPGLATSSFLPGGEPARAEAAPQT